jgi:hypothetical protein
LALISVSKPELRIVQSSDWVSQTSYPAGRLAKLMVGVPNVKMSPAVVSNKSASRGRIYGPGDSGASKWICIPPADSYTERATDGISKLLK